MTKLSFKNSFILLTAAVLVVSGFLVSAGIASATTDPAVVLGVTQITATQSYATAGGGWNKGWSWVFDVTVPANETVLNMQFADWVSGSNILPTAGNVEFYSAQSTNATSANPIVISAANDYSGNMYLNPADDLDSIQAGRQIQITVVAQIPANQAPGSYSTSYGIQTNPDTTGPVLSGTPSNINVVATSSLGAVVTYTPPTVTDPADGTTDTVSCLPASGSTFAINTTSNPTTAVTCTTTDTQSLTATSNFNVTVAPSTDATLSGLSITPGTLDQIFSPSVLSYTASVNNSVESVTVTPTVNDPDATVTVNGTPVTSGSASASIPLNVGGNTVLTVATAQDGGTTGTYTITVTRGAIPTITWSNPSDIVYGTALSATQLDATASFNSTPVAGTFVYTPALGTILQVGSEQTLSVTFNPTNTVDYNTTTQTTTINVAPAPLTVSGMKAGDKVYNGTATATPDASGASLNGVISQDNGNVTLDSSAATAAFADANVGTGKTVTVAGLALAGSAATNYTLTQPTATANITALPITVTAITDTKVYDDTNTSSGVPTITTGALVGTDSATWTQTFDNATVGTGKTLTPAGTVSDGNSGKNYNVTFATDTTGTITPAASTVTWATPSDIVYGTALSATQLDATASVPGTFVYTPDVGTVLSTGAGQTLSVTFTPTDAINHAPATQTTTINVTQATPVVTWANPSDIVYGTALSATQLDATASVPGTFVYSPLSETVLGVGPHTLSVTFTPTDAVNYTTATGTATVSVTKAPLTIAGITANNKTYDGNATATVDASGTLSGIIGADIVTPDFTSATFAFSDKNVGTGKTVTVTGIALTGADAGNYTLSNTTATTTANITPASLTVSATAGSSKVYDGIDSADQVILTTDAVSSDSVTASGVSYYLNTKNVGSGLTVEVKGITISGPDAANYTLGNTTATTTADIKPLAITGNITAGNKVYDGTTSATILTSPLTGVISPDVVTYGGGTATFSDKNVGNGKTVTATGLSLSGADAGNYTVNDTATTTADITPATTPITVTATASGKVYDGTTTATATLTPTGALGSDIVTASGTANFSDKNVGDEKTVNITGITLGGDDAGNYTLSNATATATASITALPITVTATTDTKVYDGTATSSVAPTITTGALASGDTATWTQTFDNATVGTEKTLTPAGTVSDGNSGNNYTVTLTPVSTGLITTATPTVTWANPSDIVYGTALSDTQLDATTPVAGAFVYDPASGIVLDAGLGQTLSATFTPTNTVDYAPVTKTVLINVNNQDQTAPTGLTEIAPTSVLNDGQITGTTTAMEYKLATDTTYTPVTGITIPV